MPFGCRLAGGVRRRVRDGPGGAGGRRRGHAPASAGIRVARHFRHPRRGVPQHQRRPGRRLDRQGHRRDPRCRPRPPRRPLAASLAGARRLPAARRPDTAHGRAARRGDRARGACRDAGRDDVRSVRAPGRTDRPSGPRRRAARAAGNARAGRPGRGREPSDSHPWSADEPCCGCGGGERRGQGIAGRRNGRAHRVRRFHGKRRIRNAADDHPWSAAADRTGGHQSRRGGPRHAARDSSRRSVAARRTARRARLFHRAARHRLHPAGAGRRGAGTGSDRGLGDVRPRYLLRRRALLEHRPRAHRRQRDETRQLQHVRQRDLLGGARHLLRPAERLQLHHQRARRAVRRHDHERADAQPRLERGVGRADRPLRAGLDPGDGDSLQVAPLPDRPLSDLGHQLPAQRRFHERNVLPDADPGRARVPGHVPVLVRADAGGRRGAGVRHPARGQALRHLRRDHGPERHAPAFERPRRRLRGGRQVRRDAGADRRPHLQHRLRAGGGGRAAGQPDPLQPVLSREARVLPSSRGRGSSTSAAGSVAARQPTTSGASGSGAPRRSSSSAGASG